MRLPFNECLQSFKEKKNKPEKPIQLTLHDCYKYIYMVYNIYIYIYIFFGGGEGGTNIQGAGLIVGGLRYALVFYQLMFQFYNGF